MSMMLPKLNVTVLTMRGVLDDYFGSTREYWGGTVEQLT
jgi:hypothetical protein